MLMYYVDLARHGMSDQDYLDKFKNIQAKLKDKASGEYKYKSVNLTKGIDYTKEYSEAALMFCDCIVLHAT